MNVAPILVGTLLLLPGDLVELAFPQSVSPPIEFASAILINAVVWYLIRKMLSLNSTAPLNTP
jgi:hypothetical protein